jgi:hypothetical protein
MARSEQTNEEDERQYRRIEDWFARKEKLFWTEEASDGTWEAYVASGKMTERSQSIGACVGGAATRLEAAQTARDLYLKLL